MSLKKRLAALAAAAAITLSLAGCGTDTSYVMTADGEKIAAGVYIDLMLSELTNQMYALYFSGTEVTGSYMDQEVDGVPMNEYLESYAYDTCLKIVGVEKRCEELGVTLSDEETKEISETVNSSWDANGDYYHTMGISKDSLRRVEKYSYLTEKLFDKYYGEGGIEEVSLDEIKEYVNENILRYKIITFEKDDEDEGAAAKEEADKYFALIEDEGLTMDELIERYEADNEAEEEEEESEQTTDDSTGTDDSSSDADSSADDSSNGTDSSANDSSSDSDSSADDNNSTEDEEEEEKTEAELEAEKYPNEHLRNKENVTDDEFVSFVDQMEIDSIDIYEDDNGYYIIEKLDMAKRDTYAEANKDTLISTMKAEDFEGVVDALAEAVKVVDNKEALERYNATDVYERQTEASEDN